MDEADSEAAGGLKEVEAAMQDAGRRLDQWLAAALAPALSRSRLQDLIRGGHVAIDGRPVTDPKAKVVAGWRASVRLPEPEPAVPQGEAIPLAIVFEDEHLIVVDKPAGLVVHPGAGNWTGTLVNALIHHCGDSLSGIGGVRRPGIVHRLDKDTSGLIVAAKTDAAHRALAGAFADHGRSGGLKRAYSALVWGAPQRSRGTVDAPLGRAADRTRRSVVVAGHPDARHAVTHFTVAERFGGNGGEAAVASLLECRLETGRTHQIRVHMAHIGHPLVGDRDYGRGFASKANLLPAGLATRIGGFGRQALHAKLLGFRHPSTAEEMVFEAPLPPDMRELVEGFRSFTRNGR